MSFIDKRREQKLSGAPPEKKPKKFKSKKVPLKRPRSYRIKKISQKRKVENETYKPNSEKFRKENPRCAIHSPVCTRLTQGVHHVEGKVGKDYVDESKWLPACNACNGYIESHSSWAKENGFKKANYNSKLTGVKKI